jgi:predicted aspartyl protease
MPRLLFAALALALAACRPTASAPASQAPISTVPTATPADTPAARPSAKEKAAADLAAKRDALRSAASIELPLTRLASQHIAVPVRFGEREAMEMILDTGASMTIITPQTRDAIGLAKDDGMLVQAKGAGGDVDGRVRVVVLDGIGVGERRYDDVWAGVMDLDHLSKQLGRPVAGVLGRNFLALHDLEIDFARARLWLHAMGSLKTRTPERIEGLTAIPIGEFVGGLVRLEVALGGKTKMPAVLDLGAGRSVMNWHAARSVGVKPRGKGVERSKEPVLGADNKPLESAIYRFDKLELGSVAWIKPEIHIVDLPVFATLGVAEGPAMIAGLDLLAGCRIALDYESKTLWLSRGEKGCAVVEAK